MCTQNSTISSLNRAPTWSRSSNSLRCPLQFIPFNSVMCLSKWITMDVVSHHPAKQHDSCLSFCFLFFMCPSNISCYHQASHKMRPIHWCFLIVYTSICLSSFQHSLLCDMFWKITSLLMVFGLLQRQIICMN